MVNILELLKGQMGQAAMGKIAEMVGDSPEKTSSAMGSVLPALLGSMISKGSTNEGASGMMDFMKNQNLDGGMFDNLSGLLGDSGKSSSLMKVGSLVLPFLLGGKKAGFMNLITKATGMGSGKMGTLVSLAAPMIMGMISKQMAKSGGGASGLMSLLSGQKDFIKNDLPAGMGDMLGFSAPAVETATGNAGGSGLLKWLIPLFAVLAGVWFFTKDGCSTGTSVNDNGTEMTTPVASNSADENKTSMSNETKSIKEAAPASNEIKVSSTEGVGANGKILKLDDSGNLVAGDGTMIARAGQFNSADGFYVDLSGKRLGAIADVPAMNSTSDKLNTPEYFQVKFSELLAKPEADADAYKLSQMKFNPESQRISYYSKAEFEGLAAALKANAKGKITIQVHTADGENDKESNRLSTMRAEQIKSMLQTLGVKGTQLKFKGMGAKEASKAGNNTIEIKVK